MFGRKSQSGIRLHNFAAAKKAYDATKPLRASQVRPLGERRKKFESIERVAQGFDSFSYAAVYYTTRCVEFFENGDVVLRTGGFNTASTASFISDVTGMGVCKSGDYLWVWWKGVWVPIKRELRLRRDEDGKLVVINPPKLYRKMVNKSVMAQERAKHKPLLKYIKTMLALSGGVLSGEAAFQSGAKRLQIGYGYQALYDDLLAASESKNEEAYHRLMYALGYLGKYHYFGWRQNVLCTMQTMRENLNEIIRMARADEVHVEVEVPLADRYPRGVYVKE